MTPVSSEQTPTIGFHKAVPMRIGILKADETPSEIIQTHGSYEGFYVRLLAEHGFLFRTYPVVDDVFPHSMDEADAWMVTGSRFSANDDLPWIEKLKAFVRDAHRKQVPMIGICFGHQLIASALGGTVARSPGGWTVGPVAYTRTNDATVQNLIAWHQDQVITRPSEARVLGSSEGCENAMLEYGAHARTYQCHPELPSAYARDLLLLHDGPMPEQLAVNVRQARDEGLHWRELGAEIAVFLKAAFGDRSNAGNRRSA